MFDGLVKSLTAKGYTVKTFARREDAADYLCGAIHDTTVGIGGSVTVRELGLYERLSERNEAVWHWKLQSGETIRQKRDEAMRTEVYLSSVNGIAESGEIVNIDGTGNRVASIFYGHRRVYLLIGKNKVAPDLEGAIWRARNIAAPKNAQRLGFKTPCAVKADRCYDCSSPERICRELAVLWTKPMGADIEIILIDEELGY